MPAALDSFYAQWRVRSGLVPWLREDHESPPERLLQAIWRYQRLLRDQLRTLDGQPVRILHPGFPSAEGGPDFCQAVVQFGEETAQAGDVEVDLRTSGWRAHGHDRNPAFRQVLLHVVWEGERAALDGPPALALRSVLDAPLGELSRSLAAEAAGGWPEELRGKCCAPLRQLSARQATDLLHQAAAVRLRNKGSQFQARARQVGWEQSLWEGLFRALGYKHNLWPMQRLAELRPRWSAPQADTLTVQARLFGISGLLPSELSRSQAGADHYLRRIWDRWWRERDAFSDCLLPRTLWRLHGLRPANQPLRRLALGAHWAKGGNLAEKLERWCAAEPRKAVLPESLAAALEVEPDEFWCSHWTFKSSRLAKPQPLLGCARVTDLAVNVVLPWLWSRAVEGNSEAVQCRIERRYFAWPPAQDNAVLRLARQRLLGGASRGILAGAAAQQGLIQMVRDFCEHSNSTCEACKLPGLVEAYVGSE